MRSSQIRKFKPDQLTRRAWSGADLLICAANASSGRMSLYQPPFLMTGPVGCSQPTAYGSTKRTVGITALLAHPGTEVSDLANCRIDRIQVIHRVWRMDPEKARELILEIAAADEPRG